VTSRLLQLHEEFIQQAQRPMRLGRLPIDPREHEAPILPTQRWVELDGSMRKEYAFRRPEDRDEFIVRLLAYERSVGHRASVGFDEGRVELTLTTGGVGRPTELDREYARFADGAFRELVYSPTHGADGA